MTTNLILYRRRNRAYPPSVVLLTIPNNRTYFHEMKNIREKKRPVPQMVGLRVNNLDLHDYSSSSFGWQRYSDKLGRISPAPDLVYRNTYLGKSERNPMSYWKWNTSIASSPSKSSAKKHSNDLYKTIDDRLREIEQQRNPPSRIQRPQNEDQTFRRIVGEKKSSMSKYSSTTQSSFIHNDLQSPESFVNYLNYSRLSQLSTFE